MGIDYNELPAHLQKKVDQADELDIAAESTQYAVESMKVKAVPHDHRMNKTERNYSQHLEKLKMNKEIVDWKHEPFNLRMADRTFYKPDFAVVTLLGFIEIHEVKGHWRDDALVKIKAAAEMFPWFTFKAVRNKNGHWKTRVFKTQKTGMSYNQSEEV